MIYLRFTNPVCNFPKFFNNGDNSAVYVLLETKTDKKMLIVFRNDTSIITSKSLSFRRVTLHNEVSWHVTEKFHFAGFRAGEPILGWYYDKLFITSATDRSLIEKKQVKGFGLVFLVWPIYFNAKKIYKFERVE